MIRIRNFQQSDAVFIFENWAENSKWQGCRFKRDIQSIHDLIETWNTKTHNSHYFEQFVIVKDNSLVGMISLFEKAANEVSVGIYIDAMHRRMGIATEAYRLAELVAKERGYKILSAGVLEDNVASVDFHIKVGFMREAITINSKGKKQIRFVKGN